MEITGTIKPPPEKVGGPVKSGSPLTIKPASKVDIANIGTWKSAFESAGKAYGDSHPDLTADDHVKIDRAREAGELSETMTALASKGNVRGAETFVAKNGGKNVGAMTLNTFGAERGHYVEVDFLATHPDVLLGSDSIKGVGTSLIQQAIQRAAELHTGLELRSAEGAKGFYKKFGMKHSKATGKYQLSPQDVTKLSTDKE